MTDLMDRLAGLSPEKRKLLEMKLKAGKANPAVPELAALPRDGRTFPLSFTQQRIWVMERLAPGGALYNVPMPLRLNGGVDVPALERALDALRARHETLRTTFEERDGTPVQVVHPPAHTPLEAQDLTHLSPEAARAEAQRLASLDSNTGFDLERGPVFRARLLKVAPGEDVLLMCMHHVSSDGWSLGILRGELGELYAAFREGREPRLPPLPLQYADFAAWQRTWLSGATLEKHLAFWRDALGGAPPALELPTDRPRPPVAGNRGDRMAQLVPAETVAKLRALALAEGTTLFAVLLAAYRVVLMRWSGQDDVVVGTPIANRTRREVEGMIGAFINTLALRTRLDGDPTFRELVRRERGTVLDAFSHQDLPFERVVEELKLPRDLSRAPVFQVMMALQNASGEALELQEVEIEAMSIDYEGAKFDLNLEFHPRSAEGDLVAVLHFATDLFEQDTADRLLRHVQYALDQAASDPDRVVTSIELMGDDERAFIVGPLSRTEPAVVADWTLPELFERKAAADPRHTATKLGERRVTYGELNARANRLARHLRALGAGVEDRVAVCFERTPELIEATLGVMKAGAAYVPIDPGYPAERIRFLLGDTSAKAVVTLSRFAGIFAEAGIPVVSLDADAEAIGAHDGSNPGIEIDPRSIVYVIHTSGSTGTPKGVMIEHGSFARYLAWDDQKLFGALVRAVPAVTRPTFDASLKQLFTPLVRGCKVWMVGEDAAADPVKLLRSLHDRFDVGLNCVPSLWAAMLDAIEAGEPAPGETCLKALYLGGERIPPALVERTKARLPWVRIFNLYGPTEVTATSTAGEIERADAIRIGRPADDARAYVVDALLRPVPIGVPGELVLGGGAVGRGYLGRPSLTADRFIPDPFSGEAGARMYRTGDRVRWCEDGDLEFLGRIDEQVKVRGFRIEPGEIESALREHPAVADAAVAVRGEGASARLVAYVVPREGVALPSAAELRDALSRRLPEYMVPPAFVTLDAIPRTSGGKVDRRALPEPDASSSDTEYHAPRTPAEEMLAGIFAALLGVDRVGIDDDFFALGGHSLLATQVVSRVRPAFGVELPLRAMFEAPTVRRLAPRIAALRAEVADETPAPALVPVPRDGALPLSFAQERLWFLSQLEVGSQVYNVPTPLELSGAVDADALERALAELVRRHEPLRTVFAETEDAGPVQVIRPAGDFRLGRIDFSHLPEDRKRETAATWIEEETRRPFDLREGPVFRASLARLADDRHLLMLAMHHVVTDAWSAGVLYAELDALYGAFRRGLPSPLLDLPIQYADFAAWQRAWLTGDTLERQLAYWRRALGGAPSVLELPSDRARPAVQDLSGAVQGFHLPPELSRAVRELARREGATLFMTLLAGFQAVLHRWSGQDDVVVGTPIANRTRPELEALIGFFDNTLALRTDLSGDPSFRELLRRVRETTLNAYAHQDVPFEKLVEELKVERSLSHTPLFQVMFTLQNTPVPSTGASVEVVSEDGSTSIDAGSTVDGSIDGASVEGAPVDGASVDGSASDGGGSISIERESIDGGLEMRRVGAELGTSRFDMTVGMMEAGEVIGGGVEYATALFDAETIARLTGHFAALLKAATENPDAPLSTLDVLSDAERALVVRTFNATDRAIDVDLPVHEMVAAQAARTPDAVALEFGGEALTYAELDARANRMANRLIKLGVVPDARVAVSMERSIDMVVAVLAALRAGGCYVAVDPNYPADRVAYMLEDSRAAVLVTTSALAARLPVTGTTVLSVDEDAGLIAHDSATAPNVAVDPENLLYVLYTSGSTGKPKGAALPHRALANVLRWQLARFGERPIARTLQFASLSFDVSFQEIFSTWCAGGTLVLVDDWTRRDAEQLLAYLRDQRIERLFLPFAALQNLAEIAERTDARLPDLREVITAGEALRGTPQLKAFFTSNPHARLDNHYGPSETHVISAHLVAEDAEAWPPLPPIGAPIDDTRLYVLDSNLGPAPLGVPGELFAAGANLARGYLARPGLTAERFIPNPFGPAGSRLYRTGDRARWRIDGELEYLGRVDFQVKIRGFRIEPGEVESAVASHPAVLQAAVVVRGDAAEKRLVAYVVPREGQGPTIVELRAHVGSLLPEYMVPAAWMFLETLPLTPSGKVDRRALPDPEPAQATGAAHVPPRTPAEEVVAEIWEKVLGVRPGVHDSFFDLGGHSLKATQVVSRIRQAFGVDLPLRALFEDPTVAGLAERAQTARRHDEVRLPPLVPMPRDRPIPLSFAQQRFWFVERLGAAQGAYHIPIVLTLEGTVDAAALETALNALVARHEALRTTFRLAGAEPVQVVAPELHLPLPIEDLTHLPEDERVAEAKRISDAESRATFDLERGPLLRTKLVRLSDESHLLLVMMHHIIGDAWSLGVMFRELAELYAAAREGRPAKLPPMKVQYPDYALWQRERLEGEALDRELKFWRDRLDGAATLAMPTDRPHPPVQSFKGASQPFHLHPETAKRLALLAKENGATTFMALLAAFKAVLSRWSGVKDVVVGSPVAGRVPEETEGLIGVFVNTLALRTDLGGDPTFRELLGRVREGTLDAYAHQEVPFERLVEELKIERSLSRHPLFQVIFSMHAEGSGGGGPELQGLQVGYGEGSTGTTKVDITFAVTEGAHGISGVFQYASDLFDAATMARMASHLSVLLDAATADPDRRVSELPLMPAEEARVVMEAFNDTAREYTTGECIHHLFESQVERTPDAIAVSSGDERLTYAELNARANQLARRLRKLGVGPETRVVVCMERTPELIVSLFAVHKAGGGYVPVDPAYPADRIAYMLEDSGAPVLLTHDRLTSRLPSFPGTTIRVDADWPSIERESTENPGVAVDPSNLAYAIYTSGSTGRPKGVQIEHRSTVVLMHWLREHLTDDERKSVLGSTSVSFDVSIAEIFGTLCWGGKLVLVRNALSLKELTEEVGLASMAPSAAAELLRSGGIPPYLKRLNLGGEALPLALAQGLYDAGVETVGNYYGPTEDTTYSTYSIVERGGSRVYVGSPVANTKLYVLDSNLRPTPLGVPGELWISGQGLSRGYHQRPALTAERFLPDPFAERPGARMYRVGDLVRWRTDGQLDYLGRLDHQVKIRGHRVEIGEVEAVVTEHPEVREAAVMAREDVPGDLRLVAYVVGKDGKPAPDAADLRAFVKERLPDFMIPAAWVRLEQLPLSPNGKVDRLKLPAPHEVDAPPREAHALPKSAMERTIAEVWQEVLGIASVGLDDNFFEIGGHSLLLARLQERLVEVLKREISVIDLFQYPTVGALAAFLDPRAAESDAAPEEAAARTGQDRADKRRMLMRRGRT